MFNAIPRSRIFQLVGAAALGIAAFAPSVYFYQKSQTLEQKLSAPRLAADEVRDIVEKVSKLILLPQGETPKLATVTDLEKLKGQPFFANAKLGDRVLVYDGAKKAFLYDPKANIIVEVGPIALPTPSDGSSATDAQGSQPQPVTASRTTYVALYNGTTKVGLTRDVERQLGKELDSVQVVVKENAKKNTYTDTIVVDLAGTKGEIVQKIAQVLEATVGPLPDGEEKPVATSSAQATDILVILGKDYIQQQ